MAVSAMFTMKLLIYLTAFVKAVLYEKIIYTVPIVTKLALMCYTEITKRICSGGGVLSLSS